MTKIVAITLRHWQAVTIWNLLILGVSTITMIVSPRVWTATTELTIPGTNRNLDANLGILGSLRNSDVSSPPNKQIKIQEKILTSDNLLEKLLNIDPEKRKFHRLKNYKKIFKISTDEASSLISISVKGSNRQLAKQRVINLIDIYQQRLNELRLSSRSNRRQFSQQEMDAAKNQLLLAQQKIAQFKQSSGLVNAEEQTKALIDTIDSLSKARNEAITQAEYSQSRAASLSERLKTIPENAVRSLSLGENKEYQFIKEKLSELDAEITQKRATLTEDHSIIQNLLEESNVFKEQMQRYILQASDGAQIDTTMNSQGEGREHLIEQLILAETEAKGQRRRAEQIQSQLEQLKLTLKSIPTKQAKLMELQRQVDVAEGVYKGLVAQVQQTNIDVFDAYPNVEVIDPPRTDSKPIAPKLSLIILNAMLAAIVGSIALVLMLERRNPLLNPQDLEDIKFPIVVSIPQTKTTSNKWEQAEESEVKFQRLASAVSLQQINKRRLLITSAIQGEGKTTIVLGLAQALVDLGFCVLVVDADFRQAQLTQRLTKEQQLNITQTPIVIQPNLHLLATTPQKGKLVEMVSRGQFERMLVNAESHAHYDYLLVDTPPVSMTSATALMASHIPNVLFIVRPGNSYNNSVRDSLQQLNQHHAEILGLIVNGVEATGKPYGYRSRNTVH
jgi:Mrp family chromosome partitioning ATPase